MPFVQVNDINMHYQIYHSEFALDTLVLVHGLGLNMDLWEPVIPFFIKNYKVVIFDIRGHGKTERGESTLSWDLFIEDIYELFEQLQLKSVHLLGHGFGANLAIKYSLNHKEQIKSLVLLAVPAFYPKKSIDALIDRRKQLSSSGSMLPLAQSMAKGITMEPFDSYLFQKIVIAYTMVSPETYFQVLDLYWVSPPGKDFELMSHPALSLVGAHDPLYLTSYTVTSRILIKTRLLVMPHSSNAVFIDQPELTFKWINEFIINPPVERDNYAPLEKGSPEHVMSYFHEVYEEGIKKIESLEIIQIDFLSAFRVTINGEEKLDGWNQRYAKSLLLFLTFNQTATREQICDALFPDVPLKQALNNLKVYLNYLKKLIETVESSKSILMLDKEHVALRGSIRSDVLNLKNELRKAQIEENPQLKLKVSKEILTSLPETLLPGLYDDWINHYRNKLENQIVKVAKEAAEIEKDQWNLQSSIYFLNIALKYHPDDEWLYDQSIEMYEKLKRGVSEQKSKIKNRKR
ncbi:alpha/beta fold hydrolase [Bacillus sp. FJAT-28004]|uniref:alpha/beta fold hydrolase n=1 Tax=Bacillus sp. FJAT-28004 TaxID=1679165 RepID=UPI0006B4FAB2|nr:alpha/beta hydrolase [Bacillus sp. FJAT-28004]